MATIYQCDICEKQSKSTDFTISVTIGEDAEPNWLNRTDVKLPYHRELCRDCLATMLLSLKKIEKDKRNDWP